jgi:hypothetical protein
MLLCGSGYFQVVKSISGNRRPLKMERDRLLAGEDPETIRPRDAHHWITIYAELVGFKNQLLVRVSEGMEGVSSAARVDLQDDVDLVVAQLGRYERRLRFWSARAGVLTAAEKPYPAADGAEITAEPVKP